MDTYVKTVLTVIAACLLLQVAQGFGLAGAPQPCQAAASNAEAGRRYILQAVPRAQLLMRVDLATGRTWTMPLQAEGERLWTPIDEAASPSRAREQGEGAQTQPREAAGGEK